MEGVEGGRESYFSVSSVEKKEAKKTDVRKNRRKGESE